MRKRQNIYLKYTALFIVLCVIVFMPFALQGKVLVWAKVEDGLTQHFTSLTYWGEYLRNLAGNLMSGKFQLPMWDMRLGYGADIISTLNYYAIGDPLTLFSAFVPRAYMDLFYSFLYFVRLYLAGFVFIIFCRYMKRDETGSLLGAFCYIFCSYTMLGSTKHPFFINAMIYLPIFLLGIEKIYRKEKPYCFILITGIAAISNFYFFYMLTIFIFCYALVRYYHYKKEWKLGQFILTVFEFLKYYLLGLGLVAIMFLPVLAGFLKNGRSTAQLDMMYTAIDYKKIVITMFGSGEARHWILLGYLSILGIAALVVLMQRERKYIKYKIALLFMGCGILIPLFGFVMNGMSYTANRWLFCFGFFLSYILATIYPKIFMLDKKNQKILGICIGLYSVLGFIVAIRLTHNIKMILSFVMSAGIMMMIYACVLFVRKRNIEIDSKMVRRTMLAIVSLNIIFQGLLNYKGTTYLDEFMYRGESLERLVTENEKMLQQVDDNSLYRVDDQAQRYHNYGGLSNLNSISGYYSITDGILTNTFKNQEDSSIALAYRYRGIDQREELMSLGAVKYVTQKNKKLVPRGLKRIKKGKISSLYENTNAKAFGYSYDTYITRAEYEKLNGVEKQNAMLYSAVLEEDVSGYGKSKEDFHLPVYSVKQEIVNQLKQTGEITFKKSTIYTKEEPATARLSIKKKKGYTYFLRFKKIHFAATGNNIETPGYIWVRGNHSNIRKLRVMNPGHRYYFGMDTIVVPLGSSNRMKVVLKQKSEFQFDDIEVIACKTNNLSDSKKTVHNLTNIEYKDNVYKAKIQADKKKIVCIPMPYSTGWSAYVDGKKTKLYQVNDMYQGILVEKGNHTIKLTYMSPGLKVGALISGVSLLLLLGMMVGRKKTCANEKK